MARKQNFVAAAFAAVLGIFISTTQSYSQLPYPLVPLFQYEVFYNLNLEVHPATPLVVNGRVFCNASMWSGSDEATFSAPVDAVGTVSASTVDPFANYDSSGAATFLPGAGPFSGVVPVTFPPGGVSITNAEAILQWPPSAYALGSPAAYTPDGETYLANQADLIISNAASGMSTTTPAGTNFFVYYQDPMMSGNKNPNNWASTIIWATNDFYSVSNLTSHTSFTTNYVPASSWTSGTANFQVFYAGYSFLTNVLFYDWREGWNGGNGYAGRGKSVWAVQFDVSKFDTWLTNTAVNGGGYYNSLCDSITHKDHPIGGVYIWNSVPLTTTNLPAVRVVNGSKLPDSYGLSIATPQPLYVLGNFNTTIGGASDAGMEGDVADSWPASFLADAITVLSSNWNDAVTLKAPAAGPPNTTINAACLEGIVPSNSSIPNVDNDDAQYSGGVENFLRLLESWGNLYYNGSIVVMFPSQYATNRWLQGGNYYDPPDRYWAFDTNFVNLAGLPPFSPVIINSNAAPTFAVQPGNEIVLTGQATNFAAVASGVPAVSYQWSFDGTNLSGATNALLSLTDIQVTNAGDYDVEVSNVLGSAVSSNALLSVYTSVAPVLSALAFSPASGAEFSVSGVPTFNYTVEASSNLIDWVPLMTSNAPFIFADTNANWPQRFYRGVYAP